MQLFPQKRFFKALGLGIAATGLALVNASPSVAADGAPGGSLTPDCEGRPGMKQIHAGTFMMGSDRANVKASAWADADESSAHSVDVGAFCMDTTEVTTAAYTACVEKGKCTAANTVATNYKFSIGNNFGVADRGDHPINGVDLEQATAYCEAQGQRLPTEEEWEYAARGTDDRIFPWGNEAPDKQLCWERFGEGKPNTTCAVGSFPEGNSPFGLSDMAGSVWEWTSSGYSTSYAKERTEAKYVIRGGGWYFGSAPVVRSGNRYMFSPKARLGTLGFRCADSLQR